MEQLRNQVRHQLNMLKAQNRRGIVGDKNTQIKALELQLSFLTKRLGR